MKIALLSKADASGGGASRIAQELGQLLRAAGHTAHHFLATYQTEPYPSARPLYGHYFLRRVVGRFNRYTKFFGFPELIPWEYPALLGQRITAYDLLHFHDLSSAISPLTVRWLARKRPTVWTFHDCSPFTGGCLQPMDCLNFQTRCGACPQLDRWPLNAKFDFTGFMQSIKRQTAEENNFLPVAPSLWMANIAMTSGMFVNPPVVIPNGVNLNIFKPVDRAVVRSELGLPSNRLVILISAAYVYEEQKGIQFALAALHKVKSLRPLLLIVGHMDPPTRAAFQPFDTLETGYLGDDRLKSRYFAAADLHLFCSLAENLPLTVLETMATATPTVGFSTGGVPEMVDHHHSGYLAPPGDVAGLVQGLQTALLDNQAESWGRQARLKVEQYFSHQVMLQNYLDVYATAITRFKV